MSHIGPREMVVILALWEELPKRWRVFLPGKVELLARDEAEVSRLVAAHAPGSAVRFTRIAPQHN